MLVWGGSTASDGLTLLVTPGSFARRMGDSMPATFADATVSGASVRFCDSTLRDGEQMPGVAFSLQSRLEIARELDALGVDEIEVGFAGARAACADIAAVADLGLRAHILALCRPLSVDIAAALEAGVDGVKLVTTVSPVHLRHKFARAGADVLREACSAVECARAAGLFTQVSFEDATRSPIEDLVAGAQAAVAAGAQSVTLADTVGVATPALMRAIAARIVDAVDVPVSAHCHNDFGLAVANSLAAVEGGARVLSTTVNGIGERSGNASTADCALGLERLYGMKTSLDLRRLRQASALVAAHSGVPVPAHSPIVGDNCFRHESGIHVAAILQDPSCYEPYDPALVGGERQLVLGKTSGRAAVRHVAKQLGVTLDEDDCRAVLRELKLRAENGDAVDGTEIVRSVAVGAVL